MSSYDLGAEIARRMREAQAPANAPASSVTLYELRKLVDEPPAPDCIAIREGDAFYLFLLTAQSRTWVSEYVQDEDTHYDTARTGTPLVCTIRQAVTIIDGFAEEGMTIV
jgi:hypothetical protein